MSKKIKLTKFKNMPISKKVTYLYTLFFCIVLFIISILIVFNAWMYYSSVSKKEINDTATKVEEYIKNGGEITKENLQKITDNKYIDIRVTLRDNKFFADTMKNPDEFPSFEPPMENNRQQKKNSSDNRFHTKTISNQPYMFTHREVKYNDKVYDIGIFRTYSHEYSIMRNFVILFIIINIIAFFISYYAGKYIANKILKPIRNITETAENISINDLQQRIEVPETDDEIKKLIITFNDMISRLDQSFEKQKQFISDASHDTPSCRNCWRQSVKASVPKVSMS